MIVRRKFLEGIACSLGAARAASSPTKTVHYRIDGFTCVTCAVGLDTMLLDLRGIVKSKSSYADRTSVIDYRSDVVNEGAIKLFIRELGFKASKK
jgi:Cu+-exporting ATPase